MNVRAHPSARAQDATCPGACPAWYGCLHNGIRCRGSDTLLWTLSATHRTFGPPCIGWGVASMAIHLVLESLRRVPLFASLTPEQIAEVGRGAQRHAFSQGDVIAVAGEPADGAYLILSGEAVCKAG